MDRRSRRSRMSDGRRGVKGTGRYGIGGSRYYPRRDRAMDEYGDSRGDYEGEDMRRNGSRMDFSHGGYEPIEFMGYCNGYYGQGGGYRDRGRDYADYDMARYNGRNYGGRRDYGEYDMESDYGDYGETLTPEELEKWNKKLLSQLDERERQMFSKDSITNKAKQLGTKMEGFGEKELYTATLMVMTDYKKTIGANPEFAIKLALDFLNDSDSAVSGAEKLAVYYDCIVEGE